MKVMYFSAKWCAPCKQLAPWVSGIAERRGIELEMLDIEEDAEVVGKHNVRAIPTAIIVKDNGATINLSGADTIRANLLSLISQE